MKVQVLQENFNKALSLSSRFVSTRAQLPILSNVLLKAEGTRLSILATNLEVSIATSIGAKIEAEGEITVQARTLADLISNLEKGAVDLETEEESLKVTNSHFNGTLVGMNSADFPKLPTQIGDSVIKVKSADFSKALSQVLFASSVDDTRPVLTGVLFIFEKDSLSLVATDGYRLSHRTVAITTTLEEPVRVILPKVTLSELPRMIADSEELSIQVEQLEAQVLFANDTTVLTSRIIQGDFPPFEKIIPKETKTKVLLDRGELQSAVKRAMVIARDEGFIGKMTIENNLVTISTESSKSGVQKSSLDARVIGEGLDVMFNLRFLEEFLNAVSGSEIEMGVNDINSAGIFRDTKDSSLLHLIMPVRLQS